MSAAFWSNNVRGSFLSFGCKLAYLYAQSWTNPPINNTPTGDKNVAKNLAKKGMATVKEDDEIEEAALKLKGFGKDAGPSNMSNPIARASLMKSKPAVKKKVSDMTTAEKMANSKRRKEYNEYQQSKRNEEVESDLDENEIIEPEVVETQTPEVESVVDQNMQAYVTQITQHAKDTNF